MTGYYEPLLTVSKHRTERHTTPILSTPDDLIIVDLAEAYPKLKGMRLRGKIQGRKLVPYDTRAKIVARKDLDKVLHRLERRSCRRLLPSNSGVRKTTD